ncbi:MAG: diacylglycerol/lipid kinase family protein [Anaerolineales bacterium]
MSATADARQTYVVFNPVAGMTSEPEDVRRVIADYLARMPGSYKIYQTTGDENVTEIVRQAVGRDYDLFVAVGGDGTASSVAGGLIDTGKPLAIVPTGTANTLARELSVPLDLEGALDLIVGPHAQRRIDAIRADGRHFVLSVSIGISALIMRDTGREQKQSLGQMAYIWTGLRKLLGFQPVRFRLEAEEWSRTYRAAEIIALNSGAIGMPAFQWTPDVRFDDGKMDVCVVRGRTLLDYLIVAWDVMLAREQRRAPHIRCVPIERGVTIEANKPLPVQGDGEVFGQSTVHVELMPASLLMIVPE